MSWTIIIVEIIDNTYQVYVTNKLELSTGLPY